MKIFINGEEQITGHTSLLDVISDVVKNDQPFAIAVNEKFVAKTNYEQKVINEGDCIEILSPMQGG